MRVGLIPGNTMKVLVSGANGFVGQELCTQVLARNMTVHGTTRKLVVLPGGVVPFVVGSINAETLWTNALTGCSAVVHLAARVHVMIDDASDPLDEFRRVNVEGTLNLARQAAASGVRRFVFVSTIGVNGAETFHQPFTSADLTAPHSPYAVSKYEAELELQALSSETGMEVVIIRPPMVYGPNAPGNFGSLIRWLRRGVPLPLGAINNRRSMVGLDNLVDLIVTCIDHPAAANQTFLVSDGDDLSTTELLQRLGRALGKPARLIPVPAMLLKVGAALVGKSAIAQRLCGSLQVDIQKTRLLLGWRPPLTLDQGLKKAAAERKGA